MTQKEKEPKKVGSTKTEKEVFKRKKKQEGLPSINTTSLNDNSKKKKKTLLSNENESNNTRKYAMCSLEVKKKKKYAANSA